jgi:MSHA biogenesis protein MshP
MKNTVRQQGFAAIAAIFLVVGLAALGAFMVTFSNTQQLGSAQDVQGTKAYWAARAGLEWGLGSANASSACPTSPTTLTVDGFTVTVICSLTSYAEGASTAKLIQLRAVATSGTAGSVGYIERSLSVLLEK